MTTKIVKNIKPKSEYEKIFEQICTSRQFRKELADSDMFWFFTIYFANYIEYPTAPFQKEIISLVSDPNIKIVAITAFRNSAKSTLCSLVLPIWGIVGKLQRKYVVIVCQTQTRAKEALANIRAELERIGILVNDYQPREGKSDKWSEDAIIIPKYGAKISAISISESIRGLRHLQHRPDLVVTDDLEDVASCQNYENRKKLWQFINGELIPVGDKSTKYIFIGNKVHNDSLMMKLRLAIESGKMTGVYREYPLKNSEGNIAWPGKFPDEAAIEELKRSYASETEFLREQMLLILPDGDAIVKPEDIHYYKELPSERPDCAIISIDPAYSEAANADKTAIVVLYVYSKEDNFKIYVRSLINKKLSTEELINSVRLIISSVEEYTPIKIYVEDVSAQKTLVDMLQYAHIPAEGVSIGGKDKGMRLNAIMPWIKNGQILFPITGAEDLINQMLYFGTERYDDAVDSLTLAINKLIKDENRPGFTPIMLRLKEPLRDTVVRSIMEKSGSDFYRQVSDWADRDDEDIFRRCHMRNPRRILN